MVCEDLRYTLPDEVKKCAVIRNGTAKFSIEDFIKGVDFMNTEKYGNTVNLIENYMALSQSLKELVSSNNEEELSATLSVCIRNLMEYVNSICIEKSISLSKNANKEEVEEIYARILKRKDEIK